MKNRALLGILAFCLMAVGLTFTATPAYAVVTCQQINTVSTDWPYKQFSLRCGTATQANGNTMADSLHTAGAYGNAEMYRKGVTFYLFHSAADYQAYAGVPANGLVYVNPGTAFGVTYKDPATNIPIYSAIFEVNGSVTNPSIAQAAGQQYGIGMDYLMGYVADGGIVIKPYNSFFDPTGQFNAQYNFYLTALNYDWTNFNKQTPCINGGGGVFNGLKDSANHFICNGTNGTGAGLNSVGSPTHYNALPSCTANPKTTCVQDVLKEAWASIYGSGNHVLGAEIYGARHIGNDGGLFPKSGDQYITKIGTGVSQYFPCTDAFGTWVHDTGMLPVAANLPAGCPVPTLNGNAFVTQCVKQFDSSAANGGHWPSGNVFSCDGSAMASQVMTNLEGLGRQGGPNAYTAIKQNLDGYESNIYVFNASTNFQSAFSLANRPNGDLSGNIASTYPDNVTGAQVWYTILFSGLVNSQLVDPTGIVDHELGHVRDDGSGQPSSFASYDLAMQHDWLSLNYQDFANGVKTLPCGVANSYTGPLQNVIDPSTITPQNPNGTPFCNGNVLEAKYNFGGVGSPYQVTSDIVRDPTTFGYNFSPVLYQAFLHIGAPAPNGYDAQAGWREWFAEAFMMQANPDTGASPYKPGFTQMRNNGYFQCTAGAANTSWAYPEYTNATRPNPLPCQTAMPNGWVTIH